MNGLLLSHSVNISSRRTLPVWGNLSEIMIQIFNQGYLLDTDHLDFQIGEILLLV